MEKPGCGWALSIESQQLCAADALPAWYEPSIFIKKYYRVNYGACECALSAFELHNETCNVWTHILGAFVFAHRARARLWAVLGAGARAEFGPSPGGGRGDEASALVFECSATFMFAASAGFHLFQPISRRAARQWLVVDKLGIASMIAGSFVPGVWLGFRCHALTRIGWLAVSVVLWAVGSALATGSIGRLWQRRAFAGLVASGLAPTLHWIMIARGALLARLLPRLLLMFALYALGFVFYQTRWPERQGPGAFDIFGASHQIWHVCILGAALAWAANVDEYIRLIHAPDPIAQCEPY